MFRVAPKTMKQESIPVMVWGVTDTTHSKTPTQKGKKQKQKATAIFQGAFNTSRPCEVGFLDWVLIHSVPFNYSAIILLS